MTEAANIRWVMVINTGMRHAYWITLDLRSQAALEGLIIWLEGLFGRHGVRGADDDAGSPLAMMRRDIERLGKRNGRWTCRHTPGTRASQLEARRGLPALRV